MEQSEDMENKLLTAGDDCEQKHESKEEVHAENLQDKQIVEHAANSNSNSDDEESDDGAATSADDRNSDKDEDIPKNKQIKSRRLILDSDEESEPNLISSAADQQIQSPQSVASDTESQQPAKKSKRLILDSDSSDEDTSENELPKSMVSSTNEKQFNLSDGENEEDTVSKVPEEPIYTSQNEEELPKKTIAEGLAALCDPESSDEEETQVEPEVYIKKKSKQDEHETHQSSKMSVKEAMDQRKEIESESQRMLRETHVALPYHKPKQRSLKEFLQKRPRFASALPDSIKMGSVASSIKMSRAHLEFISKKLEEREKQVEEFYKSESESDGESGIDKEQEQQSSEINKLEKENVQTNENPTEDKEMSVQNESNPELQSTSNAEKMDESNNEENSESIVTQVETITDLPETTNIVTDQMASDSIPAAEVSSGSGDLQIDESIEEAPVVNNDSNQSVTKTKLELLKEKLGEQIVDIEPKLSGAPNYIIDLDQGTTKPNEIAELMNRFMQHTSKKLTHKHSKVEVDVLCVSQGGDIHKERLAVKVDETTEPEIVETPGVKIKNLRTQLRVQMAQKRNELWQEKQRLKLAQASSNEESDFYKGEKEHCGIDDILDDEEEFSEGNESISSESEDEKEDTFNEENVEEEIKQSEDQMDTLEHDEEVDSVSAKCKSPTEKPARKLKRIVVLNDEDSGDEEELKANAEATKEDSTLSWPEDDDEVPAGQTKNYNTPLKKTNVQSKSDLGFLSPVCRLTGLQSFDATGKFLPRSPGSPAIKLGVPSPLKQDNWSTSLHKSMENLEDICSGVFPSQETSQVDATNASTIEESTVDPSTQDLLELCSGNFTGITQANKETILSEELNFATTSNNGNSKQDGCLVKKIDILKPKQTVPEETINPDEDLLISQLIDEEELEQFKKKFDADVPPNLPETDLKNSVITNQVEDCSDEDEGDDEFVTMQSKRSRKNKIMDSDEEELQNDEEEEIDLHDNDVESDIENDENQEELDYDSEENEIVVEKPKKKLHLKDFLENEAELSESEWGSDDEDEQNLDDLEFEEGDMEQYDQKKLRRDLERIHMRRLLDDDKKDIRVLQELLLDEDEELKGAGRQKQFRWRNIDDANNEAQATTETEQTDQPDEEEDTEEKWRKQRFERELFLQSQKQKTRGDDEDDNIAANPISSRSTVLKLGQRAIIKSGTSLKTTQPKFVTKPTYSVNTQRGSFLSRKDQVLARVAEYTKVSDSTVGAPKHSRNFVFQSVTNNNSAELAAINAPDNKKRKAGESTTPLQLKRLRLNGLSPAGNSKKTDKKTKVRLF